ncbi:MAG: sigma-54 dependent transcriptional regulator, partial [Candidatus Margulisbacteria bacterium]|nr:sigma-54 dependent transcriptional regulator [Candidatus Margulisiibacteriota bacterium]
MHILIVDDDQNILDNLSFPLEKAGHKCFTAKNGQEAQAVLKKEFVQLCFLDYSLPDTNGLDLMHEIRKTFSSMVCVFVTGSSDITLAVKAIKDGAYDFIEKPFELDRVNVVLNKAEREFFQQSKVHYLEDKINTEYYDSIVGNSPKIKEILKTLDKVASANTFTVLVEGDSGTGKELIAKYLHQQSKRKNNPFVEINCSAIPEQLLESELFGHEKGSFTGAVESKVGLFEVAHKGIVFLDEIGEMPAEMQSKLLRALESRVIRRVGGKENIPIDIALVAATNKNLEEQIKEKKFRDDLYYRLNVIQIKMPTLQERKEDIPALVDYFINKYNKLLGKKIKGIEVEALNLLFSYPFPGNIRELKNIIERAMLLESKEHLTADNFKYLSAKKSATDSGDNEFFSFSDLE